MKLLTELHNLHEGEVPGTGLVDINDLIKNFPTKYPKAIEKLWGGHRLAYHGIPFFGLHHSIYKMMDDAVKTWGEQGGEMAISLSDVPYVDEQGEEHMIEIQFEEQIDKPHHYGQECYMGYNPKNGKLYSGWDMSFNEENFNSEWDEVFKNETGEEYDHDNTAHNKAFMAAWNEFKELRPWIMFDLILKGDHIEIDDQQEGSGGFYPEGHKRAQEMGLIDLRLD